MPVPHAKRKEYRASYIRKHYQENKEYYKQKAAARQNAIKLYIRSLKDRPCTDCGIRYPYYVMEFDHAGDKICDVAALARKGWSIKRIEAEIAKCDLVCSNCHKERTHRRRITEVQHRSKV